MDILTMRRGSARLAFSLFHPRSDRFLPHSGGPIEFLNGMEKVLWEGDEFLMVSFAAGG